MSIVRTALAVVPAALAAVALAGCERVAATGASIAAANPLRGFEARCEALPPMRVDVVASAAAVEERFDVPYAELTARQKQDAGTHRTVGLTEVELRHASSIELAGVEDGRGRACMRPAVQVELSASPITVFVAREYRGDPCREPEILAHEYRHVDVYRRYLEEAAPSLAQALRERLGEAPHYGGDAGSLQRSLDAAIRSELSAFMAHSEQELARRNAQIDSAEAYAALGRACG